MDLQNKVLTERENSVVKIVCSYDFKSNIFVSYNHFYSLDNSVDRITRLISDIDRFIKFGLKKAFKMIFFNPMSKVTGKNCYQKFIQRIKQYMFEPSKITSLPNELVEISKDDIFEYQKYSLYLFSTIARYAIIPINVIFDLGREIIEFAKNNISNPNFELQNSSFQVFSSLSYLALIKGNPNFPIFLGNDISNIESILGEPNPLRQYGTAVYYYWKLSSTPETLSRILPYAMISLTPHKSEDGKIIFNSDFTRPLADALLFFWDLKSKNIEIDYSIIQNIIPVAFVYHPKCGDLSTFMKYILKFSLLLSDISQEIIFASFSFKTNDQECMDLLINLWSRNVQFAYEGAHSTGKTLSYILYSFSYRSLQAGRSAIKLILKNPEILVEMSENENWSLIATKYLDDSITQGDSLFFLQILIEIAQKDGRFLHLLSELATEDTISFLQDEIDDQTLYPMAIRIASQLQNFLDMQ